MRHVKLVLLISIVILGGVFWYWKSNRPQICTNKIILATEKQLRNNGTKQMLSQKDFEGLFSFISQGEYALFGDFIGCRITLPTEDTTYSVVYRSIKDDEQGVFQIFSIPFNQYHAEYAELLGNQVEKNLDLVIGDDYLFWKNDERYYFLTARPTWINILRNAKIYGDHNQTVADQTIKRTSHYTLEASNYPYFNRWVRQSSEDLQLSFNFQNDGTFMANYSKSACCTNVFHGYYRISGAVITLDIDILTQSAINSTNIPFSWDGETLKFKINGQWNKFELTNKD